jgi:hypothetical protein
MPAIAVTGDKNCKMPLFFTKGEGANLLDDPKSESLPDV